jgi:chitin disaccharide deacetylase
VNAAGRRRLLIVNADDFGRSPEVNSGVIKAHEQGIVTSASLMVRWPAAHAAAAYGRDNPSLGVGLHVDLAEWDYRDEVWVSVYEVTSVAKPSAVEAEIRSQLASFRELMGRDPTHLDSHQHVHRSDPTVSAVLKELARRLGVPLRSESPQVRYCGSFYGQLATGEPFHDAISVESLIRVVEGLSPGITELACHPGDGSHSDTTYREERAMELRALCDQRVRAVIEREGIVLCSFADIGGGGDVRSE